MSKKLDPEVKALRQQVRRLRKLLQESYDHHEYCGWGDNWERECARHQKLPERMQAILEGELC